MLWRSLEGVLLADALSLSLFLYLWPLLFCEKVDIRRVRPVHKFGASFSQRGFELLAYSFEKLGVDCSNARYC